MERDTKTGRILARPVEERFWEKADQTGGEAACWPWLSTISRYGYGLFHWKHTRQAHRVAFELANGFNAESLDHRCHTPATCMGGTSCSHRRCVNPRHLIESTVASNLHPARAHNFNRNKSHCPQGHPYSEENTVRDPYRHCRICRAAHDKRMYQNARARGTR